LPPLEWNKTRKISQMKIQQILFKTIWLMNKKGKNHNIGLYEKQSYRSEAIRKSWYPKLGNINPSETFGFIHMLKSKLLRRG
jgi:ribosomal protein S18 acetylase RimI-like enzyme